MIGLQAGPLLAVVLLLAGAAAVTYAGTVTLPAITSPRVVVSDAGETVRLEVIGLLRSPEGDTCGVEYAVSCDYRWGAIRVRQRFRSPVSRYRFHDWRRAPVRLEGEGIAAAAYIGEQEALVVVGNLTGEARSTRGVLHSGERFATELPPDGAAVVRIALKG